MLISEVHHTRQIAHLRLGLGIGAGGIRGWHRLAIQQLLQSGFASVELVIETPCANRGAGALRPFLLRCYGAWAGRTAAWRQSSADDLLQSIPRLCCSRRTEAEPAHLLAGDLRIAAEHKLDMILQLDGALLSPELSAIARYGLWRFDHGPGDPEDWPFLSAVIAGASTVSSILCRTLGGTGNWKAMREGVFQTNRWSYARTRDSALIEAARWPALIARDILLNGPRDGNAMAAPPPVLPIGASKAPRLLARLMANIALDLVRGIASFEIWNVGWSRMTLEELLAFRPLRQVLWLPKHSAGHYIADPFFLRTKPRLTWLVEDYSYFGHGRIAEVEYTSPTGPLELRPLLNLPYHTSYPFILRADGRVYCVPETAQGGALVLHESAGGSLLPVQELIRNKRIVDGTLVFEAGRWWLFCGLEDDNDTLNLHLFFANTLLDSWTPHPLNPVKSDVRSARPAGPLIRLGGTLYRPSQNCSASYGGSLTINRVHTLTPTAFHEESVLTIPPVADSPYALGLHTIGFADGFVVIDGKTRVWGFYAVATLLSKVRRRLAARVTRRSRHPGWRGFPSAASAKVWVSDQDSLPNALNLYHPYSSFGRFAKWIICLLPPQLHRRFLAGRPGLLTTDRLDYLAQIICKTLGNEKISVSFSTGTQGPHRKLTAQASYGGNILSYVKIGNTSAHFKLLRQEAEMLRWLHHPESTAAVLPTILAFEASEQHQLLFQSAPVQPGKLRPLEPDDRDACFLSALASHSDKSIAASEVFEAMDCRAFLAAERRADSSAASTLQAAMEVVCNVFGQTGIRLAPCHGDYAPWNTLELQDGSLYVFDWEYSSKEAPLFTDLFHRVLMPARLVFRQPARRVIARLLDLCDDPVLGPVISRSGIERTQLPGYLLVYLIRLAMREAGTERELSEFLSEAFGHALDAFAYPLRRRNVLVAAYACEPDHGSEPGVGWNMCQAISRENDVWVITRKNNREQIEQALVQTPNPRLRFRYADLPHWARFWKRGGRGIRAYYYLWQFAAWREARRLMQSVHFDLAHHVTFVNSYVFSFLALLPLPFVWGPVGINPRAPTELASSWRVVAKDRLRYGFQQLLRAVDPFYWLCVARARLIIGINPEVGRQFPVSVLGNAKFVCHTAIGVDDNFPSAGIRRSDGNAIRVLIVGRLIPVKGFHLAIHAFSELERSEPQARLVIVGEGPEKPRLEQLAANLGVAENVEFVGWLPRNEAMAMMSRADVFLFPSFEGAGMVVLEAMAHELPVICLDFGGPGEMVTCDCGFAVDVGTMKDTVTGLGVALRTLAHDRSMRLKMGAAAKQRVAENYLWRNRHEVIKQWYSKAQSNPDTNSIERDRATKANARRDREVS